MKAPPQLIQMVFKQKFWLLHCCLLDKPIELGKKLGKRVFPTWNPEQLIKIRFEKLFGKTTVLRYYRTEDRNHQTGLQKILIHAIDPSKIIFLLEGIRDENDFRIRGVCGLPWWFSLKIPMDGMEHLWDHPSFKSEFLSIQWRGRSYLSYLVLKNQAERIEHLLKHPKFNVETINFSELMIGVNGLSTQIDDILELLKKFGLYDKMVNEPKIWEQLLDRMMLHGIKVKKELMNWWIEGVKEVTFPHQLEELCHICYVYPITISTTCHHRLCHYCANQVLQQNCPFCRGVMIPMTFADAPPKPPVPDVDSEEDNTAINDNDKAGEVEEEIEEEIEEVVIPYNNNGEFLEELLEWADVVGGRNNISS